jgi:hypothetical protein
LRQIQKKLYDKDEHGLRQIQKKLYDKDEHGLRQIQKKLYDKDEHGLRQIQKKLYDKDEHGLRQIQKNYMTKMNMALAHAYIRMRFCGRQMKGSKALPHLNWCSPLNLVCNKVLILHFHIHKLYMHTSVCCFFPYHMNSNFVGLAYQGKDIGV